MRRLYAFVTLLSITASLTSVFAQYQPGYIVRQAGTSNLGSGGSTGAFSSITTITGRDILNPDYAGGTNQLNFVTASPYTGVWSATNDVANSEINYKPLPPYSSEPYGDLRRGPSHLYSDFVPSVTADKASYYMFYRNTANSEALCFRLRMGGIMPGSKGYSVLIDTDGKFGATGANADPNFQAASTGTNGNPGFELEAVLTTQTSGQTGIALYNVDGTSTPGLVWSGTDYTQYSQISLAGTSDNGDPDFYLDFFIPFNKITGIASLGVTSSTPLRFIPTTVMSPQAAIGGPKSDIYGLGDAAYGNTNKQYEDFILAQGQMTVTDLAAANTNTPTAAAAMCTNAPVITSATPTTVSGTWTKLSNSTQSSATILLYKNGSSTSFASTTATSGTPWSVTGLSNSGGDFILAKAQSSGESLCQSSNIYTVTGCPNATWVTAAIPAPTGVAGECLQLGTTTKGVSGNNRTSTTWTVYVSEAYTGTVHNSTTNVGSATFSNATATTWSNATVPSWNYSAGCSGGANLNAGTYSFWYQDGNGCKSEVSPVCVIGTGQNQMGGTILVPTISPTSTNTSTKSLTVTGAAGSTIALYINGQVVTSGVIAGAFNNTTTGTITFSNLSFQIGDVVSALSSRITSGTISTSYCSKKSIAQTVTCYVSAPTITTNNNGQLAIGAFITGTTREAVGTTIRVYNSANTLLATTTASATGSWTTNGATFSNGFTGMAVASTNYYAQTVLGSCTANSATVATAAGVTTGRCGGISTSPVSSSTTSLSGTLTSSATSTTVKIYLDGELIGSQSALANTTSWGPIDVTGKLYPTGVVSIGIQETGKEEQICPTTVTCTCTSPGVPTLTYQSCTNCTGETSINSGGTATYLVGNVVSGAYYSLRNKTTGESLASGQWRSSTADFSITTNALTGVGSKQIEVVSTSLSSTETCSSPSTARIFTVLPIELLQFAGVKSGNTNVLTWKTATEINASHFDIERSTDGFSFSKIGRVAVQGSGTTYRFTDAQPASANYYRLRMVDIDGRSKYSTIILLRDNGFTILLNTVRPNPFVDKVAVSLTLSKAQPVQLVLVDAAGRQVLHKTVQGVQGLNEMSLSGLNEVAEGMYMLKIIAPDASFQQKIVKGN